jgi:hypothetical protein
MGGDAKPAQRPDIGVLKAGERIRRLVGPDSY